MDHLLAALGESHRALDLGCGGGSFDYSRYRCRIIGLDFSFPQDDTFRARAALPHVSFLCGLSHQLPLSDASVDVVICNNSLEHFQQLDAALAEIHRVTHQQSRLYVAVPNGFGFDDGLYRFMLRGGGHVNRFSLASLQEKVEGATRFRLRSFRRLFSSFIYLNRPRKNVLVYLPRRMRVYYYLGPQWLVRSMMLALNGLVRCADSMFGTASSQYGWAFYFETKPGQMQEQPPNVNVCVGCGAGHSSLTLKAGKALRFWSRFYRCPSCNALNLLFRESVSTAAAPDSSRPRAGET